MLSRTADIRRPRRACPAQAVPDGKKPLTGNASSCCPARATRARAARVAATCQVVYESTGPRVHAVYTRARKEARCGALLGCSTHRAARRGPSVQRRDSSSTQDW